MYTGGTDTSNETHKPAPQSPVNKQLPKQLQQVKKQSQPQIQVVSWTNEITQLLECLLAKPKEGISTKAT